MTRISRLAPCSTCGVRPVGYRGRGECYTCKPKFIRCAQCGVGRVGYPGREHCYECKPKYNSRPIAPCRRCGSSSLYYAAGLCRRCHRCAEWVDSCRDCLAWGTTRHDGWLCQACLGWHRRHQVGRCASCQRSVTVNERGFCRLCSRQAHLVRPAHESIDVALANRHGQQLFIADTFRQKRPDPAPAMTLRTAWPVGYPVAYRQLAAFDAARDLAAVYPGDRLEPPIPALARSLDHIAADYGRAHGWSESLSDNVRRGIRILLCTQDTPGAPITASQAGGLVHVPSKSVTAVLTVLATVGMLEDDRPAALEEWFARGAHGLPEEMREPALLWIRILRDGSSTRPRTHARDVEHVRKLTRCLLTVLHDWHAQGHRTLREIDRALVLAALPHHNPYRRADTALALKSLFTVLKARRIVFTNPAARLPTAQPSAKLPLPMDTEPIREALADPDTARAAITALIAFHALSNRQVRELQLTDVRDRRLHLHGRVIPLAGPVRALLGAWLDERARRWPGTINPHLFISAHTAVRITPVSSGWISRYRAVPAQAIREDRILEEARITHGDERRLCDLFGLTVEGAQRYTRTINPRTIDGEFYSTRT
ncbi:MAG TPA: hypothetical protein VGX23_18755 [Actinocrinis sp.]|nr:hypothetical protein [Actinocrinis sp.]